MKKLRLILDVTYEPNGVDLGDLKRNLLTIVDYGIGEGMLTGDAAAEVTEYNSEVRDMTQVYHLDLEDPEHASAFFTAANDYLSIIAEHLTAQQLNDAMEEGKFDDDNDEYNFVIWERHDHKDAAEVLGNIRELALNILNQERE